ncbi:HET-domain-containing protein [Poronia punctata]|nr:HET-domain-containing protein [Poronia punctata]
MATNNLQIPAIKPTDPVCFYCSRRKDDIDPWEFQILDIGRLKSGAELGCQTCDLRFRAVSCYHSNPIQRVIFQQDSKRLTFDRRRFFEIFKLPESSHDTFRTIQTGRPLSCSTSSEETKAAIKGWIADCSATHEACSANHPGIQYMPKRVLNLGNGKVVLEENLEPRSYVCLSHCWGPSQSPVKTLSTTIDEFKQEIPWTRLTKTFQDAIDVCRRLDIHYIWIDSLCIIQDSDEDWAEESIKMAQIYASAFLTIAATKSRDGTGGCYSEREACYVDSRALFEGGSVFIRGQMPRFASSTRSKGAEHAPLLSRGWVYQEMSLSTRVLHFGVQEVVWQCRTHRRSESGSNDSDHADITFSNGHGPPTTKHNDAWDDGSPDDNPWYDVVHDYSGLDLTFDKDKLPALAATIPHPLAQHTPWRNVTAGKERATGDEFIAGLWKDTLLFDLLWQTYPHNSASGPAQKPVDSNFPSWSWASPIGSRFLGKYKHRDLVFRGPLIPVTSQDLEVSIFMRDAGNDAKGFRIDDVMAVHEFTPDYTFDLDGPVYGPAASVNYILPVMIQNGGNHVVVGIVLRPVGMSTATDAYERVGLVILVYVKRGPPVDLRPESSQEWDYHPWRPITYQWINAYLSSLPSTMVTIR